MLQVDPKKRITVRQLEDKYVRTEEWASVRDGSAIRKCLECGTKLLCLGHKLIVLLKMAGALTWRTCRKMLRMRSTSWTSVPTRALGGITASTRASSSTALPECSRHRQYLQQVLPPPFKRNCITTHDLVPARLSSHGGRRHSRGRSPLCSSIGDGSESPCGFP